ncbi:2-keto-4-pentenoate hydratase [Minwuia sp.]|uniref:2-keto-4-pentenoate hydratase n=1 Tax=Minwuia sp. TaxID=2493630 RepID=UPI003A8FFE68
MTNADGAARALMDVRMNRQRIAALPAGIAPASVEDAYALQPAVRRLIGEKVGGRQIGWKIGCTNPSAQAHLGIDEPFYGGVFERTTFTSPATVRASDFFMTVIEAEIGFRMKDDLPAAAAPYDPDSVAGAVECVLPCMEIVDSRYDEWTTIGAPHIIADNGSHGAWVHGAPVSDWQDIDLSELEVELLANGERVREGNGFAVMGNPLNALTWLANVRAVYARDGLKAGDVISTGTTIDVYGAKAGDHLLADFGALGQVELTIDKG